jgi:hypothetical protein
MATNFGMLLLPCEAMCFFGFAISTQPNPPLAKKRTGSYDSATLCGHSSRVQTKEGEGFMVICCSCSGIMLFKLWCNAEKKVIATNGSAF